MARHYIKFALLIFRLISLHAKETVTKYDDYIPEWESLDSRPLPQWYDEAKIGIFIHWGVFAVPNFGTEWFWRNWKIDEVPEYIEFMKKNYPPNFSYQDFGPQFTAELFDPDQWADLFKMSGARYVVLTSKHHEGYTLWPSKYSFSWNSMDVGPHRDIVGEFAKSIRKRTNLKFGLYHSLFEWFNPLYLSDKVHNWAENSFVTKKTMPELYELVKTYQPEVIWSDGDWEAPDTYWQSKEFLAWLFNNSPVRDTVIVNDRWGINTLCKHGDVYTCNDRYNPGTLQLHKWENAMTIDKDSWGFRANANLSDYLTIEQILEQLVTTVSCGGNLLLNVGPTKEGTIIPLFQERLLDLGKWLTINGEAIYKSKPWTKQNDTVTKDVWYTSRPDLKSVYAIFLNWPKNSKLYLSYNNTLFKERTLVYLLNSAEVQLQWNISSAEEVIISLPRKSTVVSNWAWTVKIKNDK